MISKFYEITRICDSQLKTQLIFQHPQKMLIPRNEKEIIFFMLECKTFTVKHEKNNSLPFLGIDIKEIFRISSEKFCCSSGKNDQNVFQTYLSYQIGL